MAQVTFLTLGHRSKWLRNTSCICVALALGLAAGCGNGAVAGQSKSPYEFWVLFQPGTGPQSAERVVQSCGAHNPDLIRTGKADYFQDQLRVRYYVKLNPSSPETMRLRSCIQEAPSVHYVEFPD
jgi:hypothetical protein